MTPAQPALDAMMEGVTAYDGDPCGCVMCSDEDATLWVGKEAWCEDCHSRHTINALAAEVRAQRETIAGLTAVRDMLGEWWAKEKARAEAAKATIAGLESRVEALTGALECARAIMDTPIAR
jgi:hypothetical protein